MLEQIFPFWCQFPVDLPLEEIMPAIKVKKESLAKRCEICHQSDYFDPEKDLCARCKKLTITKSDKDVFIVNWKIDLTLLANSLRNFAWQNFDSGTMKATRRVLVIVFIASISSLSSIFL